MAHDPNRDAVERLAAAMERGGLADVASTQYDLASDEFIEEWPQSGERIRGRANAKAINDHYPALTGSDPHLTLRRVSGEGEHWVVEGTIDYGEGTPVSYVGIAELRAGKLVRVTEYFANPFEAPSWRRQWVEAMS